MGSSSIDAVPSVRRVALLLGLLVALTVVGSSAVAVALPDVARDLSLDTAGTAWVLACFGLTFSVTTAVFGRLADLFGLRLPLRVGVVLFTAGSLLSGAAWSFPVLVAGRLVQGAGAGAVPVLALGIVAVRFQGTARSQALGGLTAVVSIVSGSGPLIGGGITDLLSWRAVLALPALALLLAEPVARLAPARPRPEHRVGDPGGGLDVRGALLVAMTVAATTLMLQSPGGGLGVVAGAAFAAVALIGVALLMRHVRLRPLGFLPAAVVGDPAFRRCAGAGFTLLAAYLGMLLALPLLLTESQGWRPLQIGLALLPAAALGATTASVAGALAERVGRYRLASALAAGSALGLLVASAAPTSPLLLVAGMCLVVAGFAGGQVALIDAVTSLVDDAHRGVALG
ncbi:MAG TPA: MFS transporter, partial [Egibacteraceae bacterium]|nr:MFS transporter [Egibacteraceae bacterium]